MTTPNPHEAEVVARSFTENGCTVTSIVYDPADAHRHHSVCPSSDSRSGLPPAS